MVCLELAPPLKSGNTHKSAKVVATMRTSGIPTIIHKPRLGGLGTRGTSYSSGSFMGKGMLCLFAHLRLHCFHRRLCSAVHLQRFKDVAHVILHGFLRDAEPGGDLFIAHSLRNQV